MTDTHTTAHIPDEAIHAALLSMAQDNIGADVQGLLMHGFDKLNAKPNALRNALAAALPHLALSSAPCSVEVDIDVVMQPIDDIYVRDGFCDWADVATARDEIKHSLSQIVTKPVDVEVVRRQALEDACIELEVNWPHIATPEMRAAIRALSPNEPVDRAALAQGGQNNG